MIEIVTIAVHPIVAGQADAAEIQSMGLHEVLANPSVTGGTNGLFETGVDLRMAIFTIKGRPVGFELVGGQQKAKRIVREGGITKICQRRVWTTMVGVAVAAG